MNMQKIESASEIQDEIWVRETKRISSFDLMLDWENKRNVS